jgi:luciferase family oxidoreductase group 1
MDLSVLDLSPISSGSSASETLWRTIDLAERADRLGFRRYWLAEHHNAASLASSAPEIMIGQIAARTKRIRVGAGGIMLPNHSPLKVAELFRVLSALYPGRIDLGLGRAPGTDPRTASVLRRGKASPAGDELGEELDALLGYLAPDAVPREAFARTTLAIPTGVASPELWILGSSDVGSRVARERGFGFAFARHMNPLDAENELHAYRQSFVPSIHRSEPRAIVSCAVVCAETDAEARRLAKSADLSLVHFSQGLRDLPLPSVAEAEARVLDSEERAIFDMAAGRMILGDPDHVTSELRSIAERCGADELMIITHVHDHEARCRSYALLAEAFGLDASTERDGPAHD